MRAVVLLVLVSGAVVLGGCAERVGGDREVLRVALLRAVPGSDVEPLFSELRQAGFIVGDDLDVLARDPDVVFPDPEAAEAAVREWVTEGVDLVVAFSSSGATAASRVTSEVPIVFLVNDPSAIGLVDDERAPQANLTGVTFRVPADRTVELVKRMLPELSVLGMLLPEGDLAARPHREAVVRAAASVGLEVRTQVFVGEDDTGRALDRLVDDGAGAVLVANAPAAVAAGEAISEGARERGLPLLANTAFVPGAVLVLEPDTDELLAQLGRQVVRILEGAEPGQVPVEDPRRFRLVIDARRAEELGGLAPLPDALLRQADEVLQ